MLMKMWIREKLRDGEMFTKSTIIPYFYIETEKGVRVTAEVLSETYSSVTSEGLSKIQVLS